MVRTIWAKIEGRRRLYLIDDQCDFIDPVKLYVDHLTALEKSVSLRRNTQAIVTLAGEKSRQARRRVIEAINEMQREGAAINFNAICLAARVSKTFLYDPKHSDLAQQIRSLRQLNPQSATSKPTTSKKSDSAKDAQIARFKERVRILEEQVRALQEENELLYGKLTGTGFITS